jgi:hypothetical protein
VEAPALNKSESQYDVLLSGSLKHLWLHLAGGVLWVGGWGEQQQ